MTEFESGLCVRRRHESSGRVPAMDPLSLVEERVGAVESWPAYVILHVFVDEPNARTLRNVAAFLYGNEVPVERAAYCFNACNGRNRSYVDEKIHEW
jgi:hypothetical protein